MNASSAGNRFVRGIRSGELETVEELKAAFKELAKATHPDVAGADSAAEFVAVRAEYEAALAAFERHRFGVSRARGTAADPAGAVVPAVELMACLALFLKRGFPKTPRHEKEVLRYEYARWRFFGALRSLDRAAGRPDAAVGSSAELFRAFEEELLLLRKALPDSAGAAVGFLRALVDHAAREHVAMRTVLSRELADLHAQPGLGADSLRFLGRLAETCGVGPRLDGGEARG